MKNLAQKLKKIKKPSEVHQNDVYSETHRLSKMRANYEKAREELTVQPYSQRMKPLDNFLYGFRSVYHFISVILGLATCALVSLVFVGIDTQGNEQFPPWLLILMALLIGGLLVGVLVAVEMAKVTFAKNIFKAKAKRANINTFSIVALAFLVFVSIALSGVGGALLSYKMGDKTQQLGQTLKTGENKVAKQYDQRLVQLNEVIAALEKLSVDKKARKWGLTKEEQTNLQTSKAEKIQLLAAKEKALSKLSTQHDHKLKANQAYTSTTMYVALALITFLELITIYAYSFHYQYLARTENEGVQFNILPHSEALAETPKEASQDTIVERLVDKLSEALLASKESAPAPKVEAEKPKEISPEETTLAPNTPPLEVWMQALEEKVAQITQQFQSTPAAPDAVVAQAPNEISLRPSSTRTNLQALNENAPLGTHIECKNPACSKQFQKRSHNHKYCTPNCRTSKSFILR
ncbi:hypothetical protein [uncultured Microscilla sp.]|uniref:hypothetical protein n=1 Tax=uncultured Microscilla sp. TaxID=432653 RepID=UPI00260F4B5F|nr:hypothetical protein [uncultured Microscilla sp.]